MSRTVTVQPRETLSGIARREGVPLKDLKDANPGLCQESSGPKRDEGCNWIYPGDEVVIPRSTGEKSPSALAERAWRGISGAFARAGRFIRDIRTKAAELLPAQGPTITAGAPIVSPEGQNGDVLLFKNHDELLRAFSAEQISPDAPVKIAGQKGIKPESARGLVRRELIRRGELVNRDSDDAWLRLCAQGEPSRPAGAKTPASASSPRREPTARAEPGLTLDLDVLY